MQTTDAQPAAARRGVLAAAWLRFALAVTFLTRLPLPVRGEVTPADLRASLGWYPLVGLGLGAFGCGVFWLGGWLFPPVVAAVLVIILLEMATGALHLDGFMDTCDGLGSGAPRERALEIMKDSRVGAMGVFGAAAVLLVKVSALDTYAPYAALLIGWTAARTLPVWNVACFPYARAAGTGKAFTGDGSRWPLILATAVVLAVAFGVWRWNGLLLAVVSVGATLLVQARIAKKLGGLTGDVYGMGIELAETLALLGSCVLLRYDLNSWLGW